MGHWHSIHHWSTTVGPLTKVNKKDAILCNRTVTQDAILGNCASHHFGVLNEIKDSSAKQIFTMCNTKFWATMELESIGIGPTYTK